jgi:hypothetical protein
MIIRFATSASDAIDGVAAPSSPFASRNGFGGLVGAGVQGQFRENEGLIQQDGVIVQAPGAHILRP